LLIIWQRLAQSVNIGLFKMVHVVPNPKLLHAYELWTLLTAGWWGYVGKDYEIPFNTSVGLEKALASLPPFFKVSAERHLGKDWLGPDGKPKRMVDHMMMDFVYVPSVWAADWLHLAVHFSHFNLISEVTMPQIIYILGGPAGMQHPRGYNVIRHHHVPDAPVKEMNAVTESDAKKMLRQGLGLFLPDDWILVKGPEREEHTYPLIYVHSFKMSDRLKRHLFLNWWSSLPCIHGVLVTDV
jgi:hypothetical protein